MLKRFHLTPLFLILILCINNYAYSANCPETFPLAKRIANEEMEKIMRDSKTNHDIKFHRTNISGNMNFSLPNSDNNVVVFAIIGLIVVIAWIPYAITFLYDLKYDDTNYCPWYRLQYRYKSIQNNSSELNIERDALFNGIYFGISSLKSDYSFFSFAGEIGHHEITDKINGSTSRYSGEYFMFGPSIVVGKPDGQILSVDLMGGTSTHEDVSIIAEASLNWTFNLNSLAEKYAPTVNLNFGANYLDIQDNEGILENFNQYSLFWGVGAGVSF